MYVITHWKVKFLAYFKLNSVAVSHMIPPYLLKWLVRKTCTKQREQLLGTMSQETVSQWKSTVHYKMHRWLSICVSTVSCQVMCFIWVILTVLTGHVVTDLHKQWQWKTAVRIMCILKPAHCKPPQIQWQQMLSV